MRVAVRTVNLVDDDAVARGRGERDEREGGEARRRRLVVRRGIAACNATSMPCRQGRKCLKIGSAVRLGSRA